MGIENVKLIILYSLKNLLMVYVDDIVLIGDFLEEMDRLKRLLAKEFEIKDLENLKYFLGMEVA